MKWKNYKDYEFQYPWLKDFVGTRKIHLNEKRGLLKAGKVFRDWVENNLNYIIFRPLQSLLNFPDEKKSQFSQGHFVDDERNIHYPWFSDSQYYILYHSDDQLRFSGLRKFCLWEDKYTVSEKIEWIKSQSFIPDAVLRIIWKIDTAEACRMTQEINIWLL